VQKNALRGEHAEAWDDLYRRPDFRRDVYRTLDEWSELKNWVSTPSDLPARKRPRAGDSASDDLHGLVIPA
jgi:hypothetical protein